MKPDSVQEAFYLPISESLKFCIAPHRLESKVLIKDALVGQEFVKKYIILGESGPKRFSGSLVAVHTS